jgi:hypothetical protein
VGAKRGRFFHCAREELRRLISRPASACFILGRGLAVFDRPRCRLCAERLEIPARGGETYRLAAPIVAELTRAADRDWLFFGSRIMVAMVSARLTTLLLHNCVTHLGDQVLVAMAHRNGGRHEAVLFCKPCGQGVLHKVSPAGQPHYGWDRLAELHPSGRWTRFPFVGPMARLTRRQPIPG